MKNKTREKLIQLYNTVGKHGQYQTPPLIAREILGSSLRPSKPRFEKERFQFILEHYQPKGKRVLDIGGNIGFFTFEMIAHGASQVIYYEGNETYAVFVETLAKALHLEEKIVIRKAYFPFDEPPEESYNLVLLLNVMHHIGDDFGNKLLNRARAKAKILDYLNALSAHADFLVFQMGFCWKGNRNMVLFPHGTKEEMIQYVVRGTEKSWRIVAIGIPEKHGGTIVYRPLSEKNIRRDDSLGEFLNRPLFILEAKK